MIFNKKSIISMVLASSMLTSTAFPGLFSSKKPSALASALYVTHKICKKTYKYSKKILKSTAAIAAVPLAGAIVLKLYDKFKDNAANKLIDLLPFNWLKNLFKDKKIDNGGIDAKGKKPVASFDDPNYFAPGSLDDTIKEKVAIIRLKRQNPNDKTLSIPKLMLMAGPSQIGKSTSAEAIAKELNAIKLFTINAARLEGQFVGSTASNIDKLFENAKNEASEANPSVILLDEIDGLVFDEGKGENVKAWSTISTFMSDIEQGRIKNVFLIATTNKFNRLPQQLTNRFGIFDGIIKLDYPKKEALTLALKKEAEKQSLTINDNQIETISNGLHSNNGNFAKVKETITKLSTIKNKEKMDYIKQFINKKENETIEEKSLSEFKPKKLDNSDIETALDYLSKNREEDSKNKNCEILNFD